MFIVFDVFAVKFMLITHFFYCGIEVFIYLPVSYGFNALQIRLKICRAMERLAFQNSVM